MSKEGTAPQAAAAEKPAPLHTINGAFTIKGDDYEKLYAIGRAILDALHTQARDAGASVENVRIDFAHHGDRTSRHNT